MQARRNEGTKGARRWAVVVGVVCGGVVGGWGTGSLRVPEPVDAAVWSSVTAGLDAQLATVDRGRGIYRHDGALWLIPMPFGRGTTIFPVRGSATGRVELTTGEGSGPLRLLFHDQKPGSPGIMVTVSPEEIGAGSLRLSGAREVVIGTEGGTLTVQGQGAGALSPGRVDLLPSADPDARPAKVERVRITGTDGAVLAEEVGAGRRADAAGAGTGAVIGGIGAVIGGRGGCCSRCWRCGRIWGTGWRG